MDMREALQRLEFSSAKLMAEMDKLSKERAILLTQLKEIEEQHKTLVNIIRRLDHEAEKEQQHGPPAPGHEEMALLWQGMTRLEAVHRVLLESGRVLRLSEIVTELRRRERSEDTVNLVSAALSDLKERELVYSPERGMWAATVDAPSDSPPELENMLSGAHQGSMVRRMAAHANRADR
jgi:hypothetical protein